MDWLTLLMGPASVDGLRVFSATFGLEQLLPLLLTGLGLFGKSGGSSTPSSTPTDPNMAAILESQRRRSAVQDPLYEAVTRLAMGLMPTAYQQKVPGMGDVGSAGGQYAGPFPGRERGPEGGPMVDGGGGASWASPDSLRDIYKRRTPPRV